MYNRCRDILEEEKIAESMFHFRVALRTIEDSSWIMLFFPFGLVLQSEPILIFVVGRRRVFTCTLSHSKSSFRQPNICITCRSSMLWCIILISRLKILDLITCRTKLKHPYSIHALMEFAKKCSRTTSFGGAELLPTRVLRIGGGPL